MKNIIFWNGCLQNALVRYKTVRSQYNLDQTQFFANALSKALYKEKSGVPPTNYLNSSQSDNSLVE